jgi:uncharacterized membrane protein YjgN (DUF898 family)
VTQSSQADGATDQPAASDDASAAPTAATVLDTPVNTPLPQRYAFGFTGDAREYFRIWIVNLFLTLITLGIYSAWAKVRRKRYFYGHTWLAASNFDYHAQPLAILKGRLIAAALFSAYYLASHFIPRLGTALLLILMLLAPWFIVRSMAFNAHYSSYRNLRFGFRAEYLDALRAIWPLLLVPISTLLLPELDPADLKTSPKDLWFAFIPLLIFGAVYPFVYGAVKLLHINRSRFGAVSFGTEVRIRSFYWIWLKGAGIGTVGAMFLMMVTMVFVFIPVIGVVLTMLAYAMMMTAVVAYTRSRTTNLVFNATTLHSAPRVMTFDSNLSAIKLARIYFVNALAIVVSLGLLIPWAAIRLARYRAEALNLVTAGSLEDHLADISRGVAATGEELGEMFDIDLSL